MIDGLLRDFEKGLLDAAGLDTLLRHYWRAGDQEAARRITMTLFEAWANGPYAAGRADLPTVGHRGLWREVYGWGVEDSIAPTTGLWVQLASELAKHGASPSLVSLVTWRDAPPFDRYLERQPLQSSSWESVKEAIWHDSGRISNYHENAFLRLTELALHGPGWVCPLVLASVPECDIVPYWKFCTLLRVDAPEAPFPGLYYPEPEYPQPYYDEDAWPHTDEIPADVFWGDGDEELED